MKGGTSTNKIRKLAAAVAIALIPIIFIAGCGTGGQNNSRITFGNVGEFATLNPILSTDTASNAVIRLIFNGLVKLNEKLEIVGDLAENWDYSPDGLVWTFHLRKNVKWHDGQPFTAADVKYTYDAIRDPDYTGVRATDFEPIQKVETPDDYTVKITLKEPYAPLLNCLTIGIIPKHLFESTPIKDMRQNPATMNPVGTGPYKFKTYVKGQYLQLEANPDYFLGAPKIKETIFKIYQDNQVELTAFEKGDIDYMPAIQPDDLDRIQKELAGKVDFREYSENRVAYFGLKQNHPILKDKLVRQALAYGLDREQIVRDVLKGRGTVLNSILTPVSWAYAGDQLNSYKYDPEKAKALLEQAGWKPGPDGIRVKNGQRLSFEVLTRSGDKQIEAVMNIAQQQWKDIGVEVKPQYLEFSVLCAQYLDVAKFQAYLLGMSLRTDPDFYLYFDSKAAVNDKGQLVGFNDVEYKNPQLDKLLEEGRRTLDLAKRKEIYIEAQKIVNEDLPWLFLYSRKVVSGMNNRIKGVIWSPLGPIEQQQWYIGK